MRIEIAATAPREWDAYVERHPSGSAYHRAAAVNIGRDAFGLRTSFLMARDEQSRLTGVLPLVEQSSVWFGRFLVSLPFFTYGGILADDSRVAAALTQHAIDLARARRASHVELRHTTPTRLPLAERLDKVSMILPLAGSEETLFKQFASKLRSHIRRGERERPQIAWGGSELIPEFYPVFAGTMHRLGTPVYSRRFFEVVCNALPELLSVVVLRVRDKVQAAAIVVRHARRIEVPWAAATPVAKHTALNVRMYWEMLRFAVAARVEAFDFGRSTVDSGTYRFKAQWGARPMQLHWHYWLPDGAELPRLNQQTPIYALAAACWRRLPLWCANRLGPHIVRHLP